MTHKVRKYASYNQTFVIDLASKVLLSSQPCDTAVPPANIFRVFATKRFGVVQRTTQGASKLTMRGLLAKLRTKRNLPLSVGFLDSPAFGFGSLRCFLVLWPTAPR